MKIGIILTFFWISFYAASAQSFQVDMYRPMKEYQEYFEKTLLDNQVLMYAKATDDYLDSTINRTQFLFIAKAKTLRIDKIGRESDKRYTVIIFAKIDSSGIVSLMPPGEEFYVTNINDRNKYEFNKEPTDPNVRYYLNMIVSMYGIRFDDCEKCRDGEKIEIGET